MKKIKLSILDFYFKHPFVIDILLIGGCIVLLNKYIINFPEIEKGRIDSFLSNITAAIITLAGFILASLTIIVTIKSNIKIRNLEDANNSTELLLTSNNYKKIVTVFRDAIVELVVGLLLIFVLWQPLFSFSNKIYILIILFGIFIILVTLIRALAVLFKIIFMEFN